MSLTVGEVQSTIRDLKDKHIVLADQNFKTQVEKYNHRFCNTPFSDYEFDSAQYAIICVLLLRGSRTPGELRTNCSRMHDFADNNEVLVSLEQLSGGDNSCVYMLPRTPGRRDNEYMHNFFGENHEKIESNKIAAQIPVSEQNTQPQEATTESGLEKRVADLEAAVEELRKLIE